MGFVDDLLVVGDDNGRKFGGGGDGQWLKMAGFRNMKGFDEEEEKKKNRKRKRKKKRKEIFFFRFIDARHL